MRTAWSSIGRGAGVVALVGLMGAPTSANQELVVECCKMIMPTWNLEEDTARQALAVLGQVRSRELSHEEGADLLTALGANQLALWGVPSGREVVYVGRPESLAQQLQDRGRLRELARVLRLKGVDLDDEAGLPEGADVTVLSGSKGSGHDDPLVRMDAVRKLSESRGERAEAALARAVEDESVLVRYWAVRLLAGRPGGREVPALLAALEDGSELVIRRAIRSLAGTGDSRAVRALRELGHDANPKLRRAARAVLAGTE